MKRTLFAFFIFSFALVFTGCDADDGLDTESCIRVRLVNQLCGQGILEVLSPEHFSIAETTWVDGTPNGTEYQNVFGTVFTCEDGQNIPEIGEVFYVRLIEKPAEQNCIRCLALLNRPVTEYTVRIVENCNGIGTEN